MLDLFRVEAGEPDAILTSGCSNSNAESSPQLLETLMRAAPFAKGAARIVNVQSGGPALRTRWKIVPSRPRNEIAIASI